MSNGIVLHFRKPDQGGVSEPGLVLSFAPGFNPKIGPDFMQKLCGAMSMPPTQSPDVQKNMKRDLDL